MADSEEELRATIKAAREAVALKDFKEAMKYLRAALKMDRENYNVCLSCFASHLRFASGSCSRRCNVCGFGAISAS